MCILLYLINIMTTKKHLELKIKCLNSIIKDTKLKPDIHTNAIINLANIYHFSELKNINKAIHLYKQASELGDPLSMVNLANIDPSLSKEKRIKLYTKAMELNYTPAISNLAILYDKSNEIKEAIKYYKLAIAKNEPKSFLFLAGLYLEKEHEDCTKNLNVVIDLLSKAGELGEHEAYKFLISIHEPSCSKISPREILNDQLKDYKNMQKTIFYCEKLLHSPQLNILVPNEKNRDSIKEKYLKIKCETKDTFKDRIVIMPEESNSFLYNILNNITDPI